MCARLRQHLQSEFGRFREEGLFKNERILTTSQGVEIRSRSVQISAAYMPEQIDFVIEKFKKVGEKHGAI